MLLLVFILFCGTNNFLYNVLFRKFFLYKNATLKVYYTSLQLTVVKDHKRNLTPAVIRSPARLPNNTTTILNNLNLFPRVVCELIGLCDIFPFNLFVFAEHSVICTHVIMICLT